MRSRPGSITETPSPNLLRSRLGLEGISAHSARTTTPHSAPGKEARRMGKMGDWRVINHGDLEKTLGSMVPPERFEVGGMT